jgi:hypothetical protein
LAWGISAIFFVRYQYEPATINRSRYKLPPFRYSAAPIRAHRGEQRCEREYRVAVTIWPAAANYLK